MTTARIEASPAGIRVVYDHAGAIEVPWHDVVEVHAYAVDAITHQLRYLEFTFENGGSVEVNDRQDGWGALLDAIGRHLDLRCADLYAAVDALTPHTGELLIAKRG